MAKFCGNCGAPLGDSDKVCGKCGTPLESASATVNDMKVVDPEKRKRTKKTIKLALSLAALILISVVAIKVVSQYTGYNGLIRKVMNAYENYDIDMLVSLSSDMYYYGNDDWAEYYFEYTVGDDLDSFESSVGHNYKLSYAVNETYTVSDRKLKDMLEEIESSYYDFDVSEIEKIVTADITVTAKQGNKSVNRAINIIMSKEEGSWRLMYIN